MLTPTPSARRAAESPLWLPPTEFSSDACARLSGCSPGPRDPRAPREATAELRQRLRECHDRLVERAYRLDRHGRTDASDEVNAIAHELAELLD